MIKVYSTPFKSAMAQLPVPAADVALQFLQETGENVELNHLYDIDAYTSNNLLVVTSEWVFFCSEGKYINTWYKVPRHCWELTCIQSTPGEVSNILYRRIYTKGAVTYAGTNVTWIKHSTFDKLTQTMELAPSPDVMFSTAPSSIPKPSPKPKKPTYAWTIKAGKYERTA